MDWFQMFTGIFSTVLAISGVLYWFKTDLRRYIDRIDFDLKRNIEKMEKNIEKMDLKMDKFDQKIEDLYKMYVENNARYVENNSRIDKKFEEMRIDSDRKFNELLDRVAPRTK